MSIQLVITLDDNGGVSCSGPIQDKLLCYGPLESAKDAVKGYHEEQLKQSKIVAANGADVLAISSKRNQQ